MVFQTHNFFFKKNFEYKYPKIVISFREKDQLTVSGEFCPTYKRHVEVTLNDSESTDLVVSFNSISGLPDQYVDSLVMRYACIRASFPPCVVVLIHVTESVPSQRYQRDLQDGRLGRVSGPSPLYQPVPRVQSDAALSILMLLRLP